MVVMARDYTPRFSTRFCAPRVAAHAVRYTPGMRTMPPLVLAAVLCGTAGLAGAGPDVDFLGGPPTYVSIGRDALDAALAVAEADGQPLRLLDLDADVAVIEIREGEIGALARAVHELHGRCGGFMVHDSYADARAAIPVHTDPDHAGPVHAALARPELDYALDRPAQVRAVLPRLDAARIRDAIRELSAMPSRYYRSKTGAAASEWLRDRWRQLTERPDVTVELVDHGYPQKSVIMTIPGTTRPDEVVVIGGHLDSITLGGTVRAPGADDDASGIATITEVARALLAGGYRPARTIQFMAYAAEEVGLRGSQLIVRDYKRRGVHVVGALQLDMTNYQGSDRDIWLMKDYTSAPQNAFLIALIDTYVGATWGLDACGYACSDHAAWNRAGVPASMPFEARMRQRNMAIHTDLDTLETSDASAAHALKFARLAAAYAIELGKGEVAGPDPVPASAGAAAGHYGPASGAPGHPGAAACIALFVAGLWLARAIAGRAG
jgi:leucyl aminopeptidase